MKWIALILTLLTGPAVWAQEAVPTATPVMAATATPLKKWDVSQVPWDNWFKKNAIVKDKTDYVHFFWNSQDVKVNFDTPDKKKRLAQAALQLVSRLYPEGAKADLIKLDIVNVLERDSYGEPKWDTLQRAAHLEFSREKALEFLKHKGKESDEALFKIFDKYEVY